ncbi:MAG: transporter, partial [Pseudomonadales bacterium]|nr:transporter [Pseudomonadales bacterium]
DWPSGMPAATFQLFLGGFREAPNTTLKRFCLLCSQGSAEPRALASQLLGGAPKAQPDILLAGLELLGKLDTRSALQAFNGPQLHLFAGLDGLVPVQAASDVLALLPDVEVGLIEQACHAFLLEAPHELAAAIQGFLHESGDD